MSQFFEGAVLLIGIFLLLGAFSLFANGGITNTGGVTNSKPSTVGKTVRDGQFAFTVTGVECGITPVGTSEFLTKNPQGQYCRVSLTVENIGHKAQKMFADNQYLFDTNGRRFSADSTANLYDDSSKLVFEEINPGNSATGHIYFDVPTGITLGKLELHDSMFSGGITVRL